MRLLQGMPAEQTVYGDDPLALAREHAAAGARRLHVVDLDAAFGQGDNRGLVQRLINESGLAVQVAGGVRTREQAGDWLALGAAAVVMGTSAVREPELLRAVAEAHPGRVLAALDVKGGRPAVRGWTSSEALTVAEVLAAWASAPVAGVIVTSVDRDGTLAGPDLDLLAIALEATSHTVTYSGGIASIEDLRALAAAGAHAVILGKALFERRFTLAEALAAC